uniref:FGF1 intracellular binding protein n=1 Tax=Geospiza parvula TaxID=87175 RepID=A0A8U8BI99_GEOPR
MSSDLDVFVGNTTLIDEEVYRLWLDGHSVAEAVARRLRGGVLEREGTSVAVLQSDTRDHYRTFQMLERLLHAPPRLLQQLLFQIPPERQALLVQRYYAFDEALARELLGKKLSKGTKKELDEFDNFKRVFKAVEELRGPLAENIQQLFLLPPALARDYAAIVFFANSRFETGKRRLQFLSFGDFAACAQSMMAHWSQGALAPEAAEPDGDLPKSFLQDLKELKVLVSDKDLLDQHKRWHRGRDGDTLGTPWDGDRDTPRMGTGLGGGTGTPRDGDGDNPAMGVPVLGVPGGGVLVPGGPWGRILALGGSLGGPGFGGSPAPPPTSPSPSLVCAALRGKISVYNELEANFKVNPPKNGVSSLGGGVPKIPGGCLEGEGLPQNPGNPQIPVHVCGRRLGGGEFWGSPTPPRAPGFGVPDPRAPPRVWGSLTPPCPRVWGSPTPPPCPPGLGVPDPPCPPGAVSGSGERGREADPRPRRAGFLRGPGGEGDRAVPL